jgi:hypothetical protein
MRAQSGRFSTVASVRVLPDRGSCAFCGGRFFTSGLQTGLLGHPSNFSRKAIETRDCAPVSCALV